MVRSPVMCGWLLAALLCCLANTADVDGTTESTAPESTTSDDECNLSGLSITLEQLQHKCRAFDTAPPCSGRGDCVCGQCECQDAPGKGTISGRFCECENFNCPRHNGRQCNAHGKCSCNECICEDGWSDTACQCPTSTEFCVDDAHNGLICSGHGQCVCGQCRCDDGYAGDDCHYCRGCEDNNSPQCFQHADCILCQQYGGGRLTQEQCEDQCFYNVTWTPKLPGYGYDTIDGELQFVQLCTLVDQADDCRYNFAFGEIENSDTRGTKAIKLYSDNRKECAPGVSPVMWTETALSTSTASSSSSSNETLDEALAILDGQAEDETLLLQHEDFEPTNTTQPPSTTEEPKIDEIIEDRGVYIDYLENMDIINPHPSRDTFPTLIRVVIVTAIAVVVLIVVLAVVTIHNHVRQKRQSQRRFRPNRTKKLQPDVIIEEDETEPFQTAPTYD